ncbi:hypothetical protein ACQ4PT_015481 [Festuca glaucescens]
MAPAAFDAEAGGPAIVSAAGNGAHKPAPGADADAGAAFVLESKGTWWHAGFHLTTAIVGPTVLTLPYALRGMGWALGLTALSLIAAVTFYEYSLMSRVLDHCEARGRRHIRFRELAADVLGSGWMFYFVVIVQTTINTGVSIGSILLAADCIENCSGLTAGSDVSTSACCGVAGPAITVALLRALPGVHFELVQSGLGAAYVRFRTHAAREAAVTRPPFMHADVQITLEREEEAQRVPVQDEVCALLWASPLAAEHVTPEGITALFAGFGDVVEIDPTCFGGSDMSSVKVVAKCERANLVPCDVWPKKGPWGTRVVQVEVIEVWPLERSYVDGVYQRFFDPPPPLLFRQIPRALPGRPLHAAPGTSPPAAGRGSAAAPSAYVGHGRPLLLTGPADPVAPPSSPVSGVSTVSARTSVCSPAVSEAWCSSERSSLTTATSTPARSRTCVVITELLEEPASVTAVTASAVTAAAVDAQLPDEEEALWTAVIDSAHHRRKARGKAKRVQEAVRKSGRIAAQATDMHETVYAKAVKVRELKDALKGCSAKLQAHVSKSKVMQKLLSPMGMKSVSALKAAAFGKNGMVHGGADD